MDSSEIARSLRGRVPGLALESVDVAGEGDYCLALAVDDAWIFLLAKTAEASRALARTAAVLPDLAPSLPLPVPRIEHAGASADGRPAFVGYRKLPGVELSAERFRVLPRADQDRCAADLADFLRAVHGYPVEAATRAGIPTCDYPFCATEDGISEGTAPEQYRRDLARLLSYPELDRASGDACARLLAEYLDDPRNLGGPLVLLHNEVSQHHVLVDPETGRITGIIDFNGMIVGDPVRDLLYLAEEYGPAFIDTFLAHYPIADRERVLAKLRFLGVWHTALRLLWALDHRYPPGIAFRLRELRALVSDPPR